MSFFRNRTDVLLAVLGVIGALFFIYVYSSVFPSSAIQIRFTHDQIANIAEQSLRAWGYDSNQYNLSTEFQSRDDLIRFVEKNFDSEKTKQLLDDEIPAYRWVATWERPKSSKELSDDEKHKEPAAFPNWFKRVQMFFDQSGREIAFNVEAEDDSLTPALSQEAAKAIADSVLRSRLGADTTLFKFLRGRQNTQGNRVDYSFIFQRKENLAGLPVNLQIDILGSRLGKFEYQYIVPKEPEAKLEEYIRDIPLLLLMIGFAALYIVFLIKKLRADEISFKTAWPITVIATVAFGFFIVNQIKEGNNLMGIIIGTGFSTAFIGLGVLLAIVTAEALSREAWNDKLLTFDAIRRGLARHQLLGQSLLRGIAIGLILRGLTAVVIELAAEVSTLDLVKWSMDISDINVWSPLLYRLSQVIINGVWYQFGVILFGVSIAARYFSRRYWIAATLAVFWALTFGIMSDYPTGPYWATLASGFIVGGVFTATFLLYDFVACLSAYATFGITFHSVRLIFYGHPTLAMSGWVLLGVIVALGVWGIFSLSKSISKEELSQYTPAVVKRIIERERLQRELVIARQVQLSFLPRANPHIPGLDVASICIPAMEVGGDYYDFISLNGRKLGIAIGDVSGKGISAAFYMTLTKGFLRSLTRANLSPREVLIEINSLFYENVDRGHFISMIYGVFDLETMTFTFARAGHNPVISHRMASSQPEKLCPKGLALGLEQGNIFAKVIEELTVPLTKEDVFVFYTDGFSEAMNSAKSEFGEERLQQLINKLSNKSSEELLVDIEKEVKSFVGNNSPHDDMTMVVIRMV